MTKSFIVTGPPGSGKSTVSNHLAKQFAYGIHIHCDDIYNMVKGGYQYPWDDKDGFLMNLMFDASVEIQKAYAHHQFHCVIDYVFHLNQLIQYIPKITTPIALIVLLPDCETNIERDTSRKFSIGEERIKYYNDYFNGIGPILKPFIVDNTELPVEKLVKQLVNAKAYTSSELMAILSHDIM